jgi:hypothetical protein
MPAAPQEQAVTAKRTTKAKKQHVYARVRADGALVMADQFSEAEMRRRKIRRGDLIRLVVSKKRDYTQWKKAHQLGTCIADNIDEFFRFQLENGKADSHGALKHLQRLSGVECDDMEMEIPGIGKMLIRQPRSLAFDEMEEGEFQAAYAGFCQYLINRWWTDMDQAGIEQMASLVGLSG